PATPGDRAPLRHLATTGRKRASARPRILLGAAPTDARVMVEETARAKPQEELALEREAIAWVRRLTSGEATAADAEALRAWRDQGAAHGAAFVAASRLWRDLEPVAGKVRSERVAPAVAASSARGTVSRRIVVGGGLAAAASVAGTYALVRPPLGMWPSL